MCFADGLVTPAFEQIVLPTTKSLLGDTYEIFLNPLTATNNVEIDPGALSQIDNLGIGTKIQIGPVPVGNINPLGASRGVKLTLIGGTAGGFMQWAITDIVIA